jgi:hypothetical protein
MEKGSTKYGDTELQERQKQAQFVRRRKTVPEAGVKQKKKLLQ